MKDFSYITDRVLEEADYFILKQCSTQQLADIFGVSKTTAHHDLYHKLPKIDPIKGKEARQILYSRRKY